MKISVRILHLLCLCIALLFFSCSCKRHVITEESKGREVRLKTGEIFTVKLKARLSTGYRWTLVSRPEGLELQGKPEVETAGGKIIGAMDYQIFNFKAAAAGRGVLQFVYESGISEVKKKEKEFTLNIFIE